jgi:hypothetical protein
MASEVSFQAAEQQEFQILSATYKSPTNNPFTHVHKIPAPPTLKTGDRTTYLTVLRKATAELQEAINLDLTARMEEDKAQEAGDTRNGGKACVVDEVKEEDNYGEEVVEEDN